MENITEHFTSDIKLAAWLLYQSGASLREVTTNVKSDNPVKTEALFVISLPLAADTVKDLIVRYHNREAIVEVRAYETKAKRPLMEAMRASRVEALKGLPK